MDLESSQLLDYREELRQILMREAILIASQNQPITSRSGRDMAWLFYSWATTLTARGAELAARCLLEKLQYFESTQLASYGYTSLPLLASCILLGGGRYRGLAIRDKPKSYGTGRQLEGIGDTSQPVVILDDSLVSGTSFYNSLRVLEAHGYRVEGAVCLVDFPWRGGREWGEGLGFRIETVFNIWKDLELSLPSYNLPSFVLESRTYYLGEKLKQSNSNPIHPAVAARQVAEHYLETGQSWLPTRLDGSYDTRGGVFVSLRDRETDARIARDGFICLDNSQEDSASDLVFATIKTIRSAESAIRQHGLSRLKIGISFLGPLEEIDARHLDCDRYGLVIRSRVHPWKIGATLPHTQFCTSEISQYLQTRARAQIRPNEPQAIYRYSVTKLIEPGVNWLPYGASQDEENLTSSVGHALIKRVRETLYATVEHASLNSSDDSLNGELIPYKIDGVVVSLYYHGQMIGCWVSWGHSLDSCLVKATVGAWNDNRWAENNPAVPVIDIDIVVSLLHHPENLGKTTAKRAAARLRLGVDALAIRQRDVPVLIMPHFACYLGWTADEMADAVARKAGIGAATSMWYTYQATSWLSRKGRAWPLVWGFPQDPGTYEHTKSKYEDDIVLLAEYISNQIHSNGLPAYKYFPITDQTRTSGSVGRILLSLTALEAAGRHLHRDNYRTLALRGLGYCVSSLKSQGETVVLAVPGLEGGLASECQLLLGLARSNSPHLLEEPVIVLAKKINDLFHRDGAITSLVEGHRISADHDLLPGVALAAAMSYNQVTKQNHLLDGIYRQFMWYRRRFRITPGWLIAGHQMQGWSAVYLLTANPEHAEFVFEIADWVLDWQLEKNGAFLTNLWASGPSFHTAFVAEGLADAWKLAKSIGNEERAERYARGWRDAMRFMDSLILREKDLFCMQNPGRVLGGVRASFIGTAIRIDYVAHQLLALVKGSQNL